MYFPKSSKKRDNTSSISLTLAYDISVKGRSEIIHARYHSWGYSRNKVDKTEKRSKSSHLRSIKSSGFLLDLRIHFLFLISFKKYILYVLLAVTAKSHCNTYMPVYIACFLYIRAYLVSLCIPTARITTTSFQMLTCSCTSAFWGTQCKEENKISTNLS